MKFVRLVLKVIFWVLGIALLGYVLLVCYLLFRHRAKSYDYKKPFESSQWTIGLDQGEVFLALIPNGWELNFKMELL